jgi:hypothetical protein
MGINEFSFNEKPLHTMRREVKDFLSSSRMICRNWHLVQGTGCRGFSGPVPLPLWIRAFFYSFFYSLSTF